MRIITARNILKVFFVFACADIQFLKNWSVNGLNLAQKWQFLYFKPILSAILVTIATCKSKTNARILHLGYSSNKPIRWNWWKATFRFWL